MIYDIDNEELVYNDVVRQMTKDRNAIAYVYNENIVNRLKENIPNLNITRKDFYWEITRKDKQKKLLKRKEVYEIFFISRTTLDKWIELGCPVHVVGKSKYFMQDEIEEWIKSK